MTNSSSFEIRVRLPLDRFTLDVDVTVTARVTGIFGPSGAGKTSLVECVAGLRRAEGRVVVGGDVWQDSAGRIRLAPERRRIGYVPQDALLFPHLDARGNLLAGRRSGSAGSGTDVETVVRTLELSTLLARSPSTLSGGERQRVALGRALCSEPRLLLLDEPVSALDWTLRRKILPFLVRVRERFELPILVVSHDPTVMQALCDDVIVLREGRVIARGAPRAVLTDPSVFPISDELGYRNVVPCRVQTVSGSRARVRLGSGGEGPEVEVSAPAGADAGPGHVAIPASDLLIALEAPRGLSARNVLPARLVGSVDVGEFCLLRTSVGAGLPEIVAEVTVEARDELALVVGTDVVLIVKSAACILI